MIEYAALVLTDYKQMFRNRTWWWSTKLQAVVEQTEKSNKKDVFYTGKEPHFMMTENNKKATPETLKSFTLHFVFSIIFMFLSESKNNRKKAPLFFFIYLFLYIRISHLFFQYSLQAL